MECFRWHFVFIFCAVFASGFIMSLQAQEDHKKTSKELPQQHHLQDSIFTKEQVSDRVWVIYGRGGNIGVIETDDGVIVIDTQFKDIAPGVVRQIRSITDLPIRYILNTHLHGDHVGGNPVLQEYGDVIAHQNTYDRLLKNWEGEGTPVRGDGLPQITFEKEMRFYLGGMEVQAFHYGRGHTDTDVVVWIPSENVVHMGDLFFNDIIPYVDKGNGAHTEEWIRFLEVVYQKINMDTKVIAGHGQVSDREGLQKMANYFRTIRKAVADAYESGKTKEEIEAMTFPQFDHWSGQQRLKMTLDAVYTELIGNGQTLLIVNKSGENVAFIDLETGDLRCKIKTGPNPHEVATTADGRLAYVTNYGSGRPTGARSWLTVIDVQKMEVVRDIELKDPKTDQYLAAPHGIMVTPNGEYLWVTAEGSQAVIQIRLPEEKIENVFYTGQQISHQVVPLPDGSKAYVANVGSGSVSVVNVATGEVKTIACQDGTEGIDATPDGRWIWATNRAANTISVIDTKDDEVAATLQAGKSPIRIKFTPAGKYALVSNAMDGDVAVYDVSSRKLIRTINTGDMPVGLLILPDGSKAYVANTQSDRVSVLDLNNWKLIDSFEPGHEPDGLAIVLNK